MKDIDEHVLQLVLVRNQLILVEVDQMNFNQKNFLAIDLFLDDEKEDEERVVFQIHPSATKGFA